MNLASKALNLLEIVVEMEKKKWFLEVWIEDSDELGCFGLRFL